MSFTGSCLCGAVRYAIEPPYRWFALCHCSMCRKQHGTLFGAGIGVDARRFAWLGGEDDIVHYRATAAFERPFCRHCGSKVPAVSHRPDVLVVPAGNVEGDFGMRPKSHIFAASRWPSWPIDELAACFDTYPPGIDLPLVERPAVEARNGTLAGSCLCGDVAYEVDGAVDALIMCHCSRCRRATGSAFAANSLVAEPRLRFTRGEARLARYAVPDARRFAMRFCTRCGSPMPKILPGLGTVVPGGSIDAPRTAAPAMHIFSSFKAPWYESADTLPRFAESPPAELITAR